MNEPYERVHKQEDSNSTIGTIATHVGVSLAMSGAMEGGTYLGAKKINPQKHPMTSEIFNAAAFAPGIDGYGKTVKAFTAGASTKPGRILNYGGAVAGGLLTGVLASSNKE